MAEPSKIATTAAIANAVYNAIGVRLGNCPDPGRVLAALGRIRAGAYKCSIEWLNAQSEAEAAGSGATTLPPP